MSCKKCLRYGHTVKRCHDRIATCARCSCQGHNKDKCINTEVRCCQCGDVHQTFSRNCPISKWETEIVQIQTKELIPWLKAIQKLLRLNPNRKVIFSNAVMNASNRTRSKPPTRSEQEHSILSGPQVVQRSARNPLHAALSSALRFTYSSSRFFCCISRVREDYLTIWV